jgi:hypothetical protein
VTFQKADPLQAVKFLVKARHFNINVNGVAAAASIPEITYKGPNKVGAVLFASYSIPSAYSYDWSSSFPSANTYIGKATFQERLQPGDNIATAAFGINHAAQSSDNTKIFIAGILLGLAGAAIIAAFQEARHAGDRP